MTTDKVAVVHPSGRIGGRLRSRRLSDMSSGELDQADPEHGADRLAAVLTRLDPSRHLSLDLELSVNLDGTLDSIVEAAHSHPFPRHHMWLTAGDIDALVRWRTRTEARIVHTIRLQQLRHGLERHVALLHERGIDALSMFHTDWTGGSIALAHRFGVLAFAWGARHERELAQLADGGIDGIYCDHVDRMMDVIAVYYDRVDP